MSPNDFLLTLCTFKSVVHNLLPAATFPGPNNVCQCQVDEYHRPIFLFYSLVFVTVFAVRRRIFKNPLIAITWGPSEPA